VSQNPVVAEGEVEEKYERRAKEDWLGGQFPNDLCGSLESLIIGGIRELQEKAYGGR
jgi:hypothetical protein